MIYKSECKLCKEKFRANGYYNIEEVQDTHLRENHPKEFKILAELEEEIEIARRKARDFEKVLFADMD